MSKARRNLDWKRQFELAIDPARAREIKSLRNSEGAGCTMCGKFCASDILKGLFTPYMEGTSKR